MPTEQYHEPTNELSQKPAFRETLQGILFSQGDIVKRGEAAEKEVD